MTDHEQLVTMLAARSARRGEFTLASGARSTLYVDVRMTSMSPDGLALIGPLALSAIDGVDWHPDSVGGLTLGADPISYAIAYASAAAKRTPLVRAFTVRKEAKAHGTGKLIEGPFMPGDHVVVVEDVITTGGSALKATDAIQSAGGKVAGILAVVDREEGGRERIEERGLAVLALVRAAELIRAMERAARTS